MSRQVRLAALDEETMRKAPVWLASLYPQQFDDPSSLSAEDYAALDKWMRKMIEKDDSEFYAIAIDDDVAAIIGFQEINPIDKSATMFLAVDPDAKGKQKGDGRKIMEWLQGVLMPEKFEVLRAFCFDRDRVTSNMLRKCGFNEVPFDGTMMELRADGS